MTIKQGYNSPENLKTVNDDVIAFIRKYQDDNGYPPSRRDIAAHIGAVPSTAQAALKRLADEGLITITPGIPRGIRLAAMKQKKETM